MYYGIDYLSFYTPNYYLDLQVLAKARGVDPEKFYLNLGQDKMAILPPDEDVVTMAANAANRIISRLSREEIADIEMLLFATESGIDLSKSAGIYVHQLLGLSHRCRVVELKQACYGATAGLQLAMGMLQRNPTKKILLCAADVARYSLNSAAESSQGCGAVAMLLSANPRLLTIEPESGFYTQDVMDFWRPNYCQEAFVDGQYSCEIYLKILTECWRDYSARSGRNFSDHQHFCYHMPVPKLAERAHRRLAKTCAYKYAGEEDFAKQMGVSLRYSREIGNNYTASLYTGITSLLDNSVDNLSARRIGLYSYGSGCSGEYFSAVVEEDYQQHLFRSEHQEMLAVRKELDYDQYLEFYNFKLPDDGSTYSTLEYAKTAKFRLAGVDGHKRRYL